jgi:hypothetical protein
VFVGIVITPVLELYAPLPAEKLRADLAPAVVTYPEGFEAAYAPRLVKALAAEVAPVPPFATAIVVAFHVPATNVPTPVIPVYDPDIRAVATVPDEMFEALIAVRAIPLPDTEVNVPVVPVTTFPAKEPLASRTTRVEAPLAEVALVLALSKVPVVIAEALMAVIAEPLPEKDVPVIAPAANSPDAPRRTIVEAPLAELAVVLAFAIVPEAMLDALIFEPPDKSPITAAVIVAAAKLPPESR